jgi:hypothetical protein
MKTLNIEKASVEALIAAYRSAAMGHGTAVENSNHREANVYHDKIARIYRELRRRGDTAVAALLPLLDDIEVKVRVWAAAHALEFAPQRGAVVLEHLSMLPGFIGLNATMTLREWRNGSLAFP